MIGCSFYRIDLLAENAYLRFANQIGIMAFAQTPLVFLLASKSNPISSLTGITYQKLNYLHRASGRACIFASWIHALLWTPEVWWAGHFKRWYIIWGLVAIFGFTGLWATSFRWIRRAAFEFFLVAHILLSVAFLVGALFHWQRMAYWIWPAVAIWAFDRLLRVVKTLRINFPWRRADGQCTLEMVGSDVIRLTARRRGLKWSAGQHFFLAAPGVAGSKHETHPFSAANVPSDEGDVEAVFLIRAHRGFTQRLRDAMTSDTDTSIPVFLEGPYGTAHSLEHFSTVLLVAGGTGVTFVLSHFLALLQSARSGRSPIRLLHLVWHVRHGSDVTWIAPLLNQAAKEHPDIDVRVEVFVTRTKVADEPWPGEVQTPGVETPPTVTSHGDHLSGRSSQTTLVDPAESRPLLETIPTPTTGLSRSAQEIVSFKPGRADLCTILRRDVARSEGQVNVTVCGPEALMSSARTAVREVNTPEAARRGQVEVEFFEETVGS
ncbi:hypothetical protein EHS25_002326 [Saitozyma podzolica]|uniref:ferric-chelate reductase (NADPH) n=1 Tax=Saitozyma podzolica TaxID=1890683 RepID=A0A427YE29_9TREE|nr:hypothetical protein EHS25_002326 [Saitozyma podzolica]